MLPSHSLLTPRTLMADDAQEPRRHAARAEKDPARIQTQMLTADAPGRSGHVHGGAGGVVVLPPHRPLRLSSDQPTIVTPSQTFHACDSCRKAKAKCSGNQPCVRCLSFGKKQCVYGDGKRDKERKERDRETRHHGSTRRRNEDLEDALRLLSISPNLDAYEKKGIQTILNGSPLAHDDDGEGSSRKRTSGWRTSDHLRRTQLDWEASASSTALSAESLDAVSYDVTSDESSSISGFRGQASEITWIEQAKKQAAKASLSTADADQSTRTDRMAEASYQATNLNTATLDESQINPFAWPVPAVALAFLTSYFEMIHPAFPVLLKSDFMAVFDQLAGHDIGRLLPTHGCRLAQINLVFAIGAKFAHLCNADHVASEHDHLIFYARAKSLTLEYEKLDDRPNLHQLTYHSLLCLYFVADNQVNSAWDVIGSSIRHAITLGLHLRNTAESVGDRDKEFRVRLWWSLYSLECLLGEYTGRPSCVSDDDISAPLPINRDETGLQLGFSAKKTRYSLTALDLPSDLRPDPFHWRRGSVASLDLSSGDARLPFADSTYFIHRVLLSLITHEVLARLYCASAAKLTWSKVQDLIRDFDLELIAWVQNLPPELDILTRTESSEHELERASLGMQYHSTRMILHRSCLCHSESRIDLDSQVSEGFSRTALVICIGSARELIRFLPDPPNPAEAYTKTPWWSLLHYLTQVASVLMLEIALHAEHAPNTSDKILKDAKKVVSWLRAMSIDSAPAHKCWVIFDSLLRRVAPGVGGDTDDVPRDAPMYSNWFNNFSEQPHRIFKDETDTENPPSTLVVPQHLADNTPIVPWADQEEPDWGLVPPTVDFNGEFPPQDETEFTNSYAWL